MTTYQAHTVEDLQDCVRGFVPGSNGRALRPIAGGTKSVRPDVSDSVRLDVSAISGVISYHPAECTFTARAGTTIAEVEQLLAGHGQYLPFEPPFASLGATLGGTTATALSGPGRLRYGGVRDFLLGLRFVDGEGRLLRGGSQVVKNAAGFALHQLLLGSFGTLGVITELTFKVFPHPQERATIVCDRHSLPAAVDTLARLRSSTFVIDAAELIPPRRLAIRIAGAPTTIAARVGRLTAWLQPECADVHLLPAPDSQTFWHDARNLTWAGTSSVCKVATTLSRITELDRLLGRTDPPRRYAAGGDLAWVGWQDSIDALDRALLELQLSGVIVTGSDRADRWLGVRGDRNVRERIARTLDPRRAFGGPD